MLKSSVNSNAIAKELHDLKVAEEKKKERAKQEDSLAKRLGKLLGKDIPSTAKQNGYDLHELAFGDADEGKGTYVCTLCHPTVNDTLEGPGYIKEDQSDYDFRRAVLFHSESETHRKASKAAADAKFMHLSNEAVVEGMCGCIAKFATKGRASLDAENYAKLSTTDLNSTKRTTSSGLRLTATSGCRAGSRSRGISITRPTPSGKTPTH